MNTNGGVGLSPREREYVRLYKKLYPELQVEKDVFREIAREMNITHKSAEQYRYGKPRVRTEIDLFRGSPEGQKSHDNPVDGGIGKDSQPISIRGIMQKLQGLYTLLEQRGNAKVSDMTDILKTLATLMVKFNTTYEDDLEDIQHITMKELVKKWAKTAGKLMGNAMVANMLERMINAKEEGGGKEVLKKAFKDVDSSAKVEEESVGEQKEDGGEESGIDTAGQDGGVDSKEPSTGQDVPRPEVSPEESADPLGNHV